MTFAPHFSWTNLVDPIFVGYLACFSLLLACIAAAMSTSPKLNLAASGGLILVGIALLGVGAYAIANATAVLAAVDAPNAVASARHGMALLIIGPVLGLISLASGIPSMIRGIRASSDQGGV